jgi:hypothetical protein
MALDSEEIQNRFGFHKASIEGAAATAPKHRDIRIMFCEFAERLAELLPETYPEKRYTDLAFDALEVASMWTHKSIAQSAPLIDE